MNVFGTFCYGILKRKKICDESIRCHCDTFGVFALTVKWKRAQTPECVFHVLYNTHTHLVHMCDDVWSDISSYNGLCVVVLSVWSGCVNIPPCDPCTVHVCSDNNLCVLMGHTEHDRIHEDVALLSFKCGSKSARRVWKRTVIMYFSQLLVSCNASADKC